MFGKPTRPRLLFQRLLNITDKNKRTPKNLGPTLHCRGLFPSSDVDASKTSSRYQRQVTLGLHPRTLSTRLDFFRIRQFAQSFRRATWNSKFQDPITYFFGLNNCTPTRIRDFQSCQTVTAIKAYSIQSTHSFWPDLRGSKSGLRVNAERTDEGDRVTTLQQEADFHYVVLPWIGGKYGICTI